ncbi:MAG: histidinol dehydrogenase [Clostridiales bacterium]|nr:histidinol dehydrogenase [Clostridiales bacterium]
MRIINSDGKKEFEYLIEIRIRESEINEVVNKTVLEIIDEIKKRGDEAVREYGIKFDGACPENFELPSTQLKTTFESIDNPFKEALLNAKKNIEEYHSKQHLSDYEIKRENGAIVGQVTRALERVGVYVPGGTAAYPSTVLMNCIPAKIAGVNEVVMVTPPEIYIDQAGKKQCRANPEILAAAYIAGVDRVMLAGGAQAIAALTFGTESFPRVDKIVGPGNIYVATAKKLLYGLVDIDMIAGPSEILILADESANPKFVAADLLSQAEHDRMAASILITTCSNVANRTLEELEKQISLLDRQEIVRDSLKNYGAIITCKNTKDMIELANQIAPEHLEIMMRDPLEVLKDIKNAGSVFCGDYSPEPLGDYYAGPNHVLPTSGTARFSSPLGVYSFLKRMSYTYYTKEALKETMADILEISRREGLTAHGRSIEIRYK